MGARDQLKSGLRGQNTGAILLCGLLSALMVASESPAFWAPLAYASCFALPLLTNRSGRLVIAGSTLRSWASYLGLCVNLLALCGMVALLVAGTSRVPLPANPWTSGAAMLAGGLAVAFATTLHLRNLKWLFQVFRYET